MNNFGWAMLIKPFVAFVVFAAAAVIAIPIKKALSRRATSGRLSQLLLDKDIRDKSPRLVTAIIIVATAAAIGIPMLITDLMYR